MTIASIIAKGRGRAGAWTVDRESISRSGKSVCTLRHYGTPLVYWNPAEPADADVFDYGIGWGSVSDQNGVNTAFRVLGLPYRMDRDQRGGGPRVTPLCQCAAFPHNHDSGACR